jgi:electron transfer flavoprotein alpha/beta subunit
VRIVVLIKQVPRPDSIEFDQETKTLKREGVPLVLNPFDRAAVRLAARVRRHGDELVAMTMGPPQATDALRECIALGADRCIHLSDRVFAVADTIGTSRTLAMALRKASADLVVCGRKTVDSETWQVPPEVAAFLGVPHVTSVVEAELRAGSLHATRESDEAYEAWDTELPALVSVAHADAESAEPTDGPIDVWTASDLVDDVQPNDKRFGQTGSPTRVLAVRDVTPPRLGEVQDDVVAAAARIRALLEERRSEPTQWEKPPRLGERPGKSYDCWTFVELIGDRPRRASLELLAKGRELAGKLGGRNVALVFGSAADTDAAARAAGHRGAELVVAVRDDRLGEYHPELFAHALRRVLEIRKPHALLIASTANGRDFGPRAAGELELGMTGDCVNLGIDRAGRLIQTKPAYGGNIVSIIMGATTPQLATVRARMFDPLEPRDVEPEIEYLDLDGLPEQRLRLTGRRDAQAYDLDEVDVVVVAGPEAGGLPDVAGAAAVGGTREVCADGVLPRNRQVGLFGRPVAPRLLVAAGVPGDFEHLTGFVKAGVIAAVAREPSSPMLAAADVGLVGDPRSLVPELLAAVGEL